MTLSSVGASGTSGPSTGTVGTVGTDAQAAPTGFDILLASTHPAHEPEPPRCDPNPAGVSDTPASADGQRGEETQASDASATDDADGAPTPPPRPADGTDRSGVLATLVPTPPTALASVAPGADAEVPVPSATDAAAADATPVLTPSEGDVLLGLPAAAPASTEDLVVAPTPPSSAEAAMAAFAELSTTTANASPPAGPSAPNWYTAPPAAPISHVESPPPTVPHEHAHPAPLPPVSTDTAMLAPGGPQPSSAMSVNASVDEAAVAPVVVTPPAPTEQLVSILTPLRTTPNGVYTLRLELKPPELGRVEMRVEMRDGVLHASIHTEHQSSAQLVRDALGELREHLNAEGVHTGELTVSDGGVGAHGRDEGGFNSRTTASSRSEVGTTDDPDQTPAAPAPPTTDPEATSLLDVRV